MNFFYFLPLVLALVIFGIEAFEFTGSVDAEIRTSLLSALKRFHSKEPALPMPSFTIDSIDQAVFSSSIFDWIRLSSQTNPLYNLYKLIFLQNYDETKVEFTSRFPVDFIISSLAESLDMKSLHKLSRSSKTLRYLSKAVIAKKLLDFCPYFITESNLVNSLLVQVLEWNFKDSKSIQSVNVHDEMQLLIIKYNCEALDFTAIPENIYFYIILFINESIYGAHSTVPADKFICISEFIARLRVNPELYPKSFDFALSIDSKHLMGQTIPGWKETLSFFNLKPTKLEVLSQFNLDSEFFDSDTIIPEFYTAIDESLLEGISDEEFSLGMQSICFISRIEGSRYLIDRFFAMPFDVDLNYFYELFKASAHRPYICSKYYTKFGNHLLPICKVYSASVLHELDISEIISIIQEQESAERADRRYIDHFRYEVHFLYQLEFFSKLSKLPSGDQYWIGLNRTFRTIFQKESNAEFVCGRPRNYWIHSL